MSRTLALRCSLGISLRPTVHTSRPYVKQASSYRLAIAARYWNAARLIIQHQARPVEHLEPVGYLLAMAAEIALKAFLTELAYDDRQLSRRVGHDLRQALRQALSNGLLISRDEASCILNMREAHLSHFNRYGLPATEGKLKLGAVLLTDEEAALRYVGMLIDRIAGSPKLLRDRASGQASVAWPLTLPVSDPVTLSQLEQINQAIEAKVRGIERLNRELDDKRVKSSQGSSSDDA